MQHQWRIISADDNLPKDEVDRLFEQLELVQPPPSLIQQILASISRLPRPMLHPATPGNKIGETDALDGPVVRNEQLPPS